MPNTTNAVSTPFHLEQSLTWAVTTPVSDDDFYRTLSEADSYFRQQLNATDWDLATESQKRKAMLAAQRSIDSLVFKGYKQSVYDLLQSDPNASEADIQAAYDSQAFQFPRDDQTEECPDAIFWALCEEAISLLSGRDAGIEADNLHVTSDGSGSLRVSYDRNLMPPRHTANLITSAIAWRYLQQWLDPRVNTFSIYRS